MKFEMTERDKKLLVFLSIFVIVVCIGYWGVYPNIKAMKKIKNNMEKEQAIKEENDLKISLLPELEDSNAEREESILTARESFFEMMTSDKVDKFLTNMALDYNLYAYNLNIIMPNELASLDPYYLAVKEEEVKEEDTSEKDVTDEKINTIESVEAEAGLEGDEEAEMPEEKISTGIYCVRTSFKLGGDERNLIRLIDDLSKSDKKIRIVNYSWIDERNVSYDEEGSYTINLERVLDITLELYMCEE